MSYSKIIAQYRSDYCVVPKSAASLVANATAGGGAPASAVSSGGFSEVSSSVSSSSASDVEAA